MQRLTLSLFLPALMTGFVFAQCNPVPPVTTFVTTGGNGQKGTIRGTIGDV